MIDDRMVLMVSGLVGERSYVKKWKIWKLQVR